MENTVTKPGFRKKFLGDKAFYKMVLAIAGRLFYAPGGRFTSASSFYCFCFAVQARYLPQQG